MEGECVYHELSQQLKIVLYEQLKNQQDQLRDQCTDYLLCKSKEGTQVLLLDQHFQNISNIIHIPKPIRHNCFTIIRVQDSQYVVCCHKNMVEATKIFPQAPVQRQSIAVGLEHSDQFVYLSNYISLKHCFLLVSITKKSRFYLIIIKRSNVLAVNQLQNLGDINGAKGLWTWLLKHRESHYSHWNLHLFKIDKYERFVKLLLIRDTFITLHLVQLQLQKGHSTISLVNRSQDIQKQLQLMTVKQSVILNQDYQSFRQINVFLAIQNNGFISIFKLQVLNSSQSIFSLTPLLHNINNISFQFAIVSDLVYYLNYNTQQQRFQLFQNNINWLQLNSNIRIIDEIPSVTFRVSPILKINNDQLIIISEKGINAIGRQQEESDFSIDQRRWLAYKDTLNSIYEKKIHNFDCGNLTDLSEMLEEKQKKLTGWVNEEYSALKEQDVHVMQIFGVEIVGIVVVRTIVDYSGSLQQGQVSSHLNWDQLLQACACGETSIVINLLTNIIEMDRIKLFLMLVRAAKQLGDEQYYRFGVRTIFQQPFEILLDNYQSKQESIQIIQAIVSQIACFGVVEKKHLNIFRERPETIKQIILRNHLDHLFISYFIDSPSLFSNNNIAQYLRSIKINNPEQLPKFVGQLLQMFKQKVYIKSSSVLDLLSILIESLLDFHEELLYDIDRILPGLNVFLLMKRGYRWRLLQLLTINSHFQEIKNKNFLYVLIEDILSQKTHLSDHLALLSEVFFHDIQHKESSNTSLQRGLKAKEDQQGQEDSMLGNIPRKQLKQ